VVRERVRDGRDKSTINKGGAPQTYHGNPIEIKNEIKAMKQWEWGAKIKKSRKRQWRAQAGVYFEKFGRTGVIYPGWRLGWRRWLRKMVGWGSDDVVEKSEKKRC
jgi:hypothetical protein